MSRQTQLAPQITPQITPAPFNIGNLWVVPIDRMSIDIDGKAVIDIDGKAVEVTNVHGLYAGSRLVVWDHNRGDLVRIAIDTHIRMLEQCRNEH